MELGVPQEDARIAAEVLLESDLRGIESHGVPRFEAFYINGLKDGRINPKANVRVVHEAPATALVDGDGGLGMLVGYRSMEVAIRKAAETGAGFVSTRNSRHFGIAGFYATMALKHDMIGWTVTNASPQMPPSGGADPRLGTNPLAFDPKQRRHQFLRTEKRQSHGCRIQEHGLLTDPDRSGFVEGRSAEMREHPSESVQRGPERARAVTKVTAKRDSNGSGVGPRPHRLFLPAAREHGALTGDAASPTAEQILEAGCGLFKQSPVLHRFAEHHLQHRPMAGVAKRIDLCAPPIHERLELLRIVLEHGPEGRWFDLLPGLPDRRHRQCGRGLGRWSSQFGQRRMHPGQMRLFAVDDVLIRVVEVVMAHDSCTGFVPLEKRQPFGGKLGQGLL